MLLKLFVVKNTVYRVVIDWGIFSVKIIEVKVPLMNFYSLIRIYTSRSDVPLRHLLIPTKPDFFNEFLSPWNLPPFCSTIRISPLTVGPEQWRSRDVGLGTQMKTGLFVGLFAICTSPIIHLVWPPKFTQALSSISLGATAIPRNLK